jgi:hypothetical protein
MAQPVISAIERALRDFEHAELLVMGSLDRWLKVRLAPTGQTETRHIGVGDTSYTYEVAITEPVVAAEGKFDEIVPVHQPDRQATWADTFKGTHPMTHDDHTGRIGCDSCGGVGVTGRLASCRCVERYHLERRLLDAPATAPEEKSSLELDANNGADRVELSRRAEPACLRCEGSGVTAQPCYPCRGIGWFHRRVPVELTGPEGVLVCEITPEDLAPFAFETVEPDHPRHPGRTVCRVDVAGWFTSLARPVAGPGELVAVKSDPGSASTVAGQFWPESYRPDGFDAWFGSRFGLAAVDDGDRSWPPRESPQEGPPHPLRYEVHPLALDVDLLSELRQAAAGPVAFALTGIATGEDGPAVFSLDEHFRPQAELAADYRLVDAILEATDRLQRS